METGVQLLFIHVSSFLQQDEPAASGATASNVSENHYKTTLSLFLLFLLVSFFFQLK